MVQCKMQVSNTTCPYTIFLLMYCIESLKFVNGGNDCQILRAYNIAS